MAKKNVNAPQYKKVFILTKGSSGKKPDVVPRCGELEYDSNEQIEWVIVPPNVEFTIRFDKENGSPFKEKEFTRGNNISGEPTVQLDPNEDEKLFRYSLDVEEHDPIDPGVMIFRPY